MSIIYSQIVVYILLVIVTSAIVGFLSERPTTPQNIEGFTGTDDNIEALNAELSDPRFADGWWQEQINMMLEIGKKAEQQSLAKYGLDFVTETYLPEKLSELGLN